MRGSGPGDGSNLCGETGRLPKSCCLSGHNFDVSLSGAAVRALGEAQDYVAALSFIGMQLRILGSSDANISKYNMNRHVEFVTLGEFHDDRHFPPMRVSRNGNLVTWFVEVMTYERENIYRQASITPQIGILRRWIVFGRTLLSGKEVGSR